MDAAAKKSFEVQAQIRHNAQELKSALNDLYSWEKSIKDKEQDLNRHPAPVNEVEHLKTLPIRSHVTGKAATNAEAKQNVQTENQQRTDTNPAEEKRKRANECKDRGNKHVKLGEYKLAINEYTNAIEVYDEDPAFFTNRALCYLKMEKYEDCIEDCERAIILDSLAVKAYYRRMQANESLGNNMDALKDCTSVLMIDPKNTDAKKSLERINERLRKNTKTSDGPNFTPSRSDFIDILPIEKPSYKRSNKPLLRVPIADVVGPKDNKNYQNSKLQISDEELDKIFNSNCGSYVEVKKDAKNETTTSALNTNTLTSENTKTTSQKENQAMSNVPTTKTNAQPTTSSKQQQQQEASKNTAINNSAQNTKQNPIPRPLPPVPTSTAQFYSNWKELTGEQKHQYLKSINVTNLSKILGAGFDSDTLTDILNTLRDYYVPQRDANLGATLLEVSKNDQVAILSLLMSTDERKALTDIINSLKENKANASVTKQIAENFNLH